MPMVEEMWAWLAEEEDGEEGVIAYHLPEGPGPPAWMPLVGADKDRIESFRGYAQTIANSVGVPVRLVRFSNREVLEEL